MCRHISQVLGAFIRRVSMRWFQLALKVMLPFRNNQTDDLYGMCLILHCGFILQYSPFITLCLGSIGMDHVISEPCYKGGNFTKEL